MRKFSSITKVNSRQGWRNKRLTYFSVAAIGVILAGMLLPAAFQVVAGVVMMPVQGVRVWLYHSSDSLPQYLRDRTVLIDRIAELEQALTVRSGTALSIERLQSENEQLRSLLGSDTTPRILASVVARPPYLPYDRFEIDRGGSDGVVVGAPVFAGYDQIIGVVTQVAPTYALVTMVTSPQFVSTVYVFGPNIYTEAEGQGGGILRVRVPQGIALNKGNLVVLPATDSGVFGEVALVEAIPTEPEQYGYVSATTPLQELRFVAVGRQPLKRAEFEDAEATVAAVRAEYFKVPVPADRFSTVGSTTAPTTSASIE